MEILIGKTAGFCYGVKRAVESAEKEANSSKELTYCLGEIVHNKQVVDELKQKGIKFIEAIENANGKTIIRAHGVDKEVYNKAKEQGIELVDCTCPNVLKIHKIAKAIIHTIEVLLLVITLIKPPIPIIGANTTVLNSI